MKTASRWQKKGGEGVNQRPGCRPTLPRCGETPAPRSETCSSSREAPVIDCQPLGSHLHGLRRSWQISIFLARLPVLTFCAVITAPSSQSERAPARCTGLQWAEFIYFFICLQRRYRSSPNLSEQKYSAQLLRKTVVVCVEKLQLKDT